MKKIFVILENINFGYFSSTLDIFSLLSIISATVVITIKNPIASIMCLIILFSAVSLLLISMGLTFIGLAYLLVYVGAVSILFLFILMLINVRVSELISETKNSIPLVFLVTFVFISASPVVFYNVFISNLSSLQEKSAATTTHENWEDVSVVFDHLTCIGYILYTIYAILLIIVSLILLLAMVGAIAISVKQKLSKYLVTERTVHSSLFAIFSINCPKPHSFVKVTLQSGIVNNSVTIRFIKRLFVVLVAGLIIRSFIHFNCFGEWENMVSLLCYLILFMRVLFFECILDSVNPTESILNAPQVNFVKRPGSPLESGSSKIGRYGSSSPESPAPVATAPVVPTPAIPAPAIPAPAIPAPVAPAPEVSSPEVSSSEASSPDISGSEGSSSPQPNQGSDRSATQSPEQGTEYLTDQGWLVVQSISAVEDDAENRTLIEELGKTETPNKNDIHELAYFIELAHARTSYNPATNVDIKDHIVNHMESNETQARLAQADKAEVNSFYLPKNDSNDDPNNNQT